MHKKHAVATGVGLIIFLSAGCSPEPKSAPSAKPAIAPLAETMFLTPTGPNTRPEAVTYDPKLVPPGSSASVTSTVTDGKTKVTLQVRDLVPNHEFGAHVHTKDCGRKPADPGPRYQNRNDPVSPPIDPAFANAKNEVWLDFVTDEHGGGSASAAVDWTFRERQAKAVVIHARHTSAEPGKAGDAGERVGCLNADF